MPDANTPKKSIKSDEKHLKAWLTQKLRRLSYQWPARKQAIRNARVSRGKYECAMCKEAGIEALYGPKQIVLDHIHPVIDPFDGWVDWNNYIERLFCDVDNWQVLCKDHHDMKTTLENEIRKDVKKDEKKS